MKRILISALLLPLCACVDIEKQPYESDDGADSNIVEAERKKDIAQPKNTIAQIRKVGIIEEEKVPKHVENSTRVNFSPINDFDKIAMQMTGRYVPKEFINDRIYYGYIKFLDREWARLRRNSLEHIPAWSAKNIASKVDTSGVVFYPLGGPDVAYALSFFPNASEYVLVGLEPIGKFDDVKKAVNDPKSFEQIRRSLATYLKGGYFITSEMGKTLSNKFLRGTLYLILLELSALNFEIHNVENISVDQHGDEVARGQAALNCVKITCKKRGKENLQHIYYMRADLSDSNVALINIFNFMKRKNFYTFLKSASYAIWDKSLSRVRRFILDNSRFILQDDTGAPFSSFDQGWNIYAFGSYTEPTLSRFRKVYNQPRMAEFFENSREATIPFKIGYGFYQARPNLLLAVSKNKIKNDNKKIIEEVEELKKQRENADNCNTCGHAQPETPAKPAS